jgi:hypothetical protein
LYIQRKMWEKTKKNFWHLMGATHVHENAGVRRLQGVG